MQSEEDLRYSRHYLFAHIGRSGQKKLINSRIAIVGAGAIGSMLANHMARAGVGYLRIIDADKVEMSNLQRQVLYTEEDAIASREKALAASKHLNSINKNVHIDPHVQRLTSANAEPLLADIDIILDGTDNMETRFLINDVSVKHHIPWVYAAAVGSRGMMFPFIPKRSPCFHCLFPPALKNDTSESCDAVGVIGTAVGVIASLAATEALKILLDDYVHVTQKLRHLDLWTGDFGELKLGSPRAHCPTCADHTYPFLV